MRKNAHAATPPAALALMWPVQVSNGALLCAQTAVADEGSFYCWAVLLEAPGDPAELTGFSPAELAAQIIRHARKFHPAC